MGLRVFSLIEEDTYGTATKSVPEFTTEVTSASYTLGAEPITSTGGSRMIKSRRNGYASPEGTTEGYMDLDTIGYYLKAVLGDYSFTGNAITGTDGKSYNCHEFWGGERTKLPSFTQRVTYDFTEKTIYGAMADTFKLEVNDELSSISTDWVYKTEEESKIDPENYTTYPITNKINTIGYDYQVFLNNDENSNALFTEFSMEIKNNLNTDGTKGLGSRFPQRKAAAQQREIELSLKTYFDEDLWALIMASEYGELPADDSTAYPSDCKLYSIPLTVRCKTCEQTDKYIDLVFPDCLFTAEREISESDEIEVELTLQACGTKEVNLLNGDAKTTDVYAKLVNQQGEITAN